MFARRSGLLSLQSAVAIMPTLQAPRLERWGSGKFPRHFSNMLDMLGIIFIFIQFKYFIPSWTRVGVWVFWWIQSTFLQRGWGRECQQHRQTQVLSCTMEDPRRRTRDKHRWAPYMPRYAGRHPRKLAISALESGIGSKIRSLSLNPYAEFWNPSLPVQLPPSHLPPGICLLLLASSALPWVL